MLGKHPKGLLGLLVPGEAEGEHANRLRAPIDVGDHMDADLVVEQLLHPVAGDRGVDTDEQVSVLHHHPGHRFADMDQRRQLRESPAIVIELDVRLPGQLVGIDIHVRGRARRDLIEHPMGQIQQRRLHMSVLLDGGEEELVGVPRRQQLETTLQLPVHATDHVNQHRVGGFLWIDRAEIIGQAIQIGKVSVGELRFVDVSLEEGSSLVRHIGRCEQLEHGEQTADLAETAVDHQVDLPDAHAMTQAFRTSDPDAISASPSCDIRFGSTSPVHSSMNTFFTSIARAHPSSP